MRLVLNKPWYTYKMCAESVSGFIVFSSLNRTKTGIIYTIPIESLYYVPNGIIYCL